MAWWRTDASREDDEQPATTEQPPEWARSPWEEPAPPLPGPDVLSSERPRKPARPARRAAAPPKLDTPAPSEDEQSEEPPISSGRPTIGDVRRWGGDRKSLLLAIAVFVTGTMVGGAVIHGYDRQQAAAARRDTVNLSARVAEDSTPRTGAQRPWVLRIIVTNSGQTDILIHAARLADGRFKSHLREVSQDTRILAGQESWLSLDVTHSCVDGGPAPAPQSLELTVTPSGRPERDLRVRLADDGSRMVDAARQNCTSPGLDIWTNAELAGPATIEHGALAVPVLIHLVGPEALAVRDIRTSSPGLSVLARPLPVRFTNGVTDLTVLMWTVADCARAKVLTFGEIGISTTLMLVEDGESVRSGTILNADGVLDIVRYISSKCR